MRYKDEAKQSEIIRATVKLVNQVGFAASSVSKIAKEADVSPATIYIYYENKEDLLVSTYVDIKKRLSETILKDFEDSKPIRDILKTSWFKTFHFISNFPDDFQYTEQFANSPYSSLVDKDEVDKHFEPIIKVIQTGIQQKIIKDVPLDILLIFVYYPVAILSNPRLSAKLNCDEKCIETAFNMAWDAIKL
jgi:AcrR family transcriptional regulator